MEWMPQTISKAHRVSFTVTKLLRTVIINWEEVEPGNYARKVKVNLTFQLELFPLGEGADIADFMEVLEEETDQPGEDPGDGQATNRTLVVVILVVIYW